MLLLAVAVTGAHASIIIDSFTTAQELIVSGPAAGNPKMGANSTANNAPLSLGGQREFVIRRTAGNRDVVLDVDNAFEGAITLSVPSSTGARALLTWDGPGIGTAVNSFAPASGLYGVPDTFDLNFGLGYDLTQKGWNDRVRMSAWADNAVMLTFTFYRSASIFTRGSVTLPQGSTVYDPVQDYDVPVFGIADMLFTNLVPTGGTTDQVLRGTRAITLQIDALSSQDVVLELLSVTNGPGTEPAPEPSSLALFGLGLTCAGVATFRNRLRPSTTDRR